MKGKPIHPVVLVWLEDSGQPIVHKNAQIYQKRLMYHVFEVDENRVFQYPIDHIWRVQVDYPKELQAHPNE